MVLYKIGCFPVMANTQSNTLATTSKEALSVYPITKYTTMDVLKSVDIAAVQSTWGLVKTDINTHAPKFYVALLTAHPEYHPMFPTIANVPKGELLNNAALKTLSVNVLTKFSQLIDSLGNLDALNGLLVDLAHQHKSRGTNRGMFDNLAAVLVDFLATNLGAAFTPEAKTAWTSTMKGINTIIEASS